MGQSYEISRFGICPGAQCPRLQAGGEPCARLVVLNLWDEITPIARAASTLPQHDLAPAYKIC